MHKLLSLMFEPRQNSQTLLRWITDYRDMIPCASMKTVNGLALEIQDRAQTSLLDVRAKTKCGNLARTDYR